MDVLGHGLALDLPAEPPEGEAHEEPAGRGQEPDESVRHLLPEGGAPVQPALESEDERTAENAGHERDERPPEDVPEEAAWIQLTRRLRHDGPFPRRGHCIARAEQGKRREGGARRRVLLPRRTWRTRGGGAAGARKCKEA